MALIIKSKYLHVFIFVLCCFFQSKGQVVYEVQDSALADFTVYVTDDTLQAEIRVFRVLNANESHQVGLWYQTNNINEASYKVFYLNDPNLADLHIFYSSDINKIGWIDESKKVLQGDKSYLFNKQ
jgi:hypothetical protein